MTEKFLWKEFISKSKYFFGKIYVDPQKLIFFPKINQKIEENKISQISAHLKLLIELNGKNMATKYHKRTEI